jgi:hypothetical protein
MNQPICSKELRREKVRRHKRLYGLDYLEVGQMDSAESSLDAQRVLTVYFLGRLPDELKLDKTSVRIEGGQRIRDIQVLDVKVCKAESSEFDDYMTVVVDRPGDFSTYVLHVVEKKQGKWRPHSKFDPRYDRITFNFKVDCPDELDCRQEAVCPPERRDEPDINYLAKDYASFRQLILDRLALVMPDWRERHVPDIGIALVEILAYVGDHLSYFQDAVATEAYLNTARKRISVRRHARLVDYFMHEGCNARTWVCVQVCCDSIAVESKAIFFITGLKEALQNNKILLTLEELERYPAGQYEVFEPIADESFSFYKAHNEINFYTWGNQLCCLARGATSATLLGEWVVPEELDQVQRCDLDSETQSPSAKSVNLMQSAQKIQVTDLAIPKLNLRPGDVLIFEEVVGPKTGHPQDADPNHRHAVRLRTIEADIDPLTHQPITHITWDDEDALPFPLCLSALGPPPECKVLENVSVARGNVVLVDHGQTVEEALTEVPKGEIIACCKREGMLADSYQTPGRYQPVLEKIPLTFREQPDNHKSAYSMLKQDVRRAKPALQVIDTYAHVDEQQWQSQLDLFSSHPHDLHFVVEMDEGGRAHLRFGNGEMGKRPEVGMSLQAKYRIGNGLAGNVGAGVISHLVARNASFSGVNKVYNPMPAQGGTAVEPMSEAKLFAPHAFRNELQRAIIADDYAAIVLREFKHKVQNALGKLRWNGSWYEVLVAIDPYGQEQVDQALLDEISDRLHRYRRMGHDVMVRSAHRIPLDIELRICVLPNYLRGHIKAELLKIFSNKRLSDGSLGFFHADNLTFGQDIYLSKLVAAAQSVEGIESVTVTKMQRWCELANDEIGSGVLPLGPFEIARLDNDPSFPENGKLNLDMRGGR